MLTSKDLQTIERIIGYTFSNKGLLIQAFTRSSYHNEHPDSPDNEVLELIGDSVLSLSVLTYFKKQYTKVTSRGLLTDWNEGKFSALKSALVNKHRLAACIEQLGLASYLLVSRGDSKVDIEREASVKEDLFESIIGAIYIDSGENFNCSDAIVQRMLDIDAIVEESRRKLHISHRNDLQEWCQSKARRFDNPSYSYRQLAENRFLTTVQIPEIGLTVTTQAKSTKEGYEAAAKQMLEKLLAFPKDHFDRPEKATLNYVGKLLEQTQKAKQPAPLYRDVAEVILPDQTHRFTVSVTCLGISEEGTGASKKEARQNAAQKCLDRTNKI